ncbi:NADPH-dependent FMN reductase [Stakelama tenebrarum]|uniref:NAD(P)H-dependent oxidoreductase n=1 Tax=Stakelama tenebrarum TaxID=2711215 RepID=A0A6G6Y1Q0_9SPHN|nr:NADPH-dependent FMN reductase [Sphingosinithalassobacter tenebrarum]QIG78737.1 NAD(P)H-dependent oxidoreductase [Sphingosinithalassobacter tenebrarum]
MTNPHIVALGGTLRPQSSTGQALAAALAVAEARGARTTLLTGDAIDFPNFDPETAFDAPNVAAFVDTLRSADAVLIGSPGYHGTLSGLVKNALDHVELTRGDDRVYFDGLPVGLISTAAGWQAAVSTLQALRTIVHALRGWPTPLGVAINTAGDGDAIAECSDQMALMVGQMFAFLDRR